MTRFALAISLLASCAAVARTTDRAITSIVALESEPVEVRVERRGDTLVAFATRPRRCRGNVVDTVEVGQARHQRAFDVTWPCPQPATHERIVVRLPSGQPVEATTDDRGELVYVLDR